MVAASVPLPSKLTSKRNDPGAPAPQVATPSLLAGPRFARRKGGVAKLDVLPEFASCGANKHLAVVSFPVKGTSGLQSPVADSGNLRNRRQTGLGAAAEAQNPEDTG